ncbi:MAG TPA: hypothetical protein VEC96_11295, partial [Anaerolineae bacterium]|nr:hypothetical protein [Anaerolineae bacterium]
MTENYQHLGGFSDWVQAAHKVRPLFPVAPPGTETQQKVREVLGFFFKEEMPREVKIERRWEQAGLSGEEISWSVGYGPRTQAWLIKPAGATEPLPGLVALHDHGAFKFYGKEKIADGPDEPLPLIRDFRETYYGG